MPSASKYKSNRLRLAMWCVLVTACCTYACKKSAVTATPSTYFKVYDLNLKAGQQSGNVFRLFSDVQGNAYLIGSDTDFYMMKFDAHGNYLFKKEFGSVGTLSYFYSSILFDGSCFYAIHPNDTNNHAYLTKVDLNGNLLLNSRIYISGGVREIFDLRTSSTLLPNGNIVWLGMALDTTANPKSIPNVPALVFFSNSGVFIGATFIDTIAVDTNYADFNTIGANIFLTKDGGYFALFETIEANTVKFVNLYCLNNQAALQVKRTYPFSTFSPWINQNEIDHTSVIQNSDGELTMLFDGSIHTLPNAFTTIDTALNILRTGQIDFALSYIFALGGGNFMSLGPEAQNPTGINFPGTTNVLEIAPDLSVKRNTVFGEKNGSIYLSLMTPCADNSHLFFGAIQGFGDVGNREFLNVLIKTDANEKY